MWEETGFKVRLGRALGETRYDTRLGGVCVPRSFAGYPGHESEALELLRDLSAEDAATVACSQVDVIPDVLERAARRDHVELPTDFPSKKASTWVLSFDGRRLFGADYIPPPRTDI